MVGTIKIGAAVNKIYRRFFKHGGIVPTGQLFGKPLDRFLSDPPP
jgi:hypothetical protein